MAAALFAGLACAAVLVGAVESRGEVRTRRSLLIAYVLGATLLAGVSQRNLWPLSSWSLMTGTPPRQIGVDPIALRLVAVDDSDHEYAVDYRAVEPFPIEELMAWMRKHFFTLTPTDRDSAARFVLERVNAARARVRAGEPPGVQGRLLGRLRAPYHTLHPRQWTAAESVPASPFVALRVYGEGWDLEERARDPTRVTRRRLYEYRPGGVP